MTPTELEAALRELQWAPKDIHRLTGKTVATIKGWRTGLIPVPRYMQSLVTIALAVRRSYAEGWGLLAPASIYRPLSSRTHARRRQREAAMTWPTPDDWAQG